MGDRGDLFERLDNTVGAWSSVRARYRVWQHVARSREAFVAQAKQGRGSLMRFAGRGGAPEPEELEELVSVWWRRPDRVRVQYAGGAQNGVYAVRVGDRWWRWDRGRGATSNVGDPELRSGVGDEFRVLVEPAALLGLLRFAVLERAERAGRELFVADAWPRQEEPRELPAGFQLHPLEQARSATGSRST